MATHVQELDPSHECHEASWSCTVELPFFVAAPTGCAVDVFIGESLDYPDGVGDVSLCFLNGLDGVAAFRERRMITKWWAPPSEVDSIIARLVLQEPQARIYRWPAATVVRAKDFAFKDLSKGHQVPEEEYRMLERVFFAALNKFLMIYAWSVPPKLAAEIDIVTPSTVPGVVLRATCRHGNAEAVPKTVYDQYEPPETMHEDDFRTVAEISRSVQHMSIPFQRLISARMALMRGDFGATLFLAWSAVEVIMRAIAPELSIAETSMRNAKRLVEAVASALAERGAALPADFLENLDHVRIIRNTFVHRGLQPSWEVALEAIHLCGNAVALVSKAARGVKAAAGA